MDVNLSLPQPKAPGESPRAVAPTETLARAARALAGVGLALEPVVVEHGGVFWTATVPNLHALLPPGMPPFRAGGKGGTEVQCRTSVTMEVVERWSLYRYGSVARPEHRCLDLRDGREYLVADSRDMSDTRCVAAGNTYEDAILHALEELVETRLGHTYLWQPFLLVNVEELWPELPSWVAEDLVLVKHPTPVAPFHHFTALRHPAEGVFDVSVRARFLKHGERLFFHPGGRKLNQHSPGSGSAAGLDPRTTAFRAMNEIFQGGVTAVGVGTRRRPPRGIATLPARELGDYSTSSITGDIQVLLDHLPPDTFVGVVDVTAPELGIPVVKLVSDFDPNTSLYSEETLERIFCFDASPAKVT